MPRSIWNGAIAFGAVTVPVKVFGALEDRSIHFHEVHVKDGGGIEHRLVSSDSGREVKREKVVKGYEVGNGKWVVLSNDEIKAADQPERKAVEIEDFVPGEQIDPVYYDKPYNLAPQRGAEQAYALLNAALEKTGRVGVGRVVLRTKEQVVAIRPAGDGLLRMHTMHATDEIVSGDDLDVPKPRKKAAKREVDMAGKLVDGLVADFDPKRYKDTYRKRVLDLVKRKAEGKEIEIEEPEAPEPSDDLMAALQASLDASTKSNGRGGGSKRKKGKR
jgi:DNA end-binding protein Ku